MVVHTTLSSPKNTHVSSLILIVTEFGKTYKDRFALRTYPGTSVPIFIFILGWSRTKPRVTLSAQTMVSEAAGGEKVECSLVRLPNGRASGGRVAVLIWVRVIPSSPSTILRGCMWVAV